MPKIDPDILKDFGRAVKRARTLKGWDQPTLGGKIDPPVGPSFISKVEKGRKEALDARTVGRFRIALDLEETWIDKFLDAEEVAESLETKSERDADRVINRLKREGKSEGTSNDLLIQLANNFTESDHKDLETAYRSVEAALERLKASTSIARLAGNADAQFAALMEEVDELNSEGEFDLAHDKLARQAEWLREEKDRLTRLSELQLEKELNQDRLRNRPDLAADRITQNLRDFPQGKLFWAVNLKAHEWTEEGNRSGDIFALNVALALAKGNYDRTRGKRSLAGFALRTLGWSHLRLAERSSSDRPLKEAQRAFEASLKRISKVKDPVNWAARQNGLGVALSGIGIRLKDPELLKQSVAASHAALQVIRETNSADIKSIWNNYGTALRGLGELTKDVGLLRDAEEAILGALTLEEKESDPLHWGGTQNNLALTQRWLGAITNDLEKLNEARRGFAACEELALEGEARFRWAALQWNIADLALARYQLDPDPSLLAEARERVIQARAFFVDGSDYQTERCDALLAQIAAKDAAS